MTNDYKRGHEYRMKTDSNYRERHNGNSKLSRVPRSTQPRKNMEWHHTPKGGRWVSKTEHTQLHGMKRGKTPYRGKNNKR